jgi:predicted SPOUT superfamily RNA methylase MTH1
MHGATGMTAGCLPPLQFTNSHKIVILQYRLGFLLQMCQNHGSLGIGAVDFVF